jgi:uncharacterized protein (UPF0254 family)
MTTAQLKEHNAAKRLAAAEKRKAAKGGQNEKTVTKNVVALNTLSAGGIASLNFLMSEQGKGVKFTAANKPNRQDTDREISRLIDLGLATEVTSTIGLSSTAYINHAGIRLVKTGTTDVNPNHNQDSQAKIAKSRESRSLIQKRYEEQRGLRLTSWQSKIQNESKKIKDSYDGIKIEKVGKNYNLIDYATSKTIASPIIRSAKDAKELSYVLAKSSADRLNERLAFKMTSAYARGQLYPWGEFAD